MLLQLTSYKTVANKIVSQRNRVICHGSNNDKMSKSYLIFQDTKNQQISLYDVKDAYESCHAIRNDKYRCDCYKQFGVNGTMVDKYYLHVKAMERQYEMPDDPLSPHVYKKKSKRRWFPFQRDNDDIREE